MSKIQSSRVSNATSLHQLMFVLQHLSDELLSNEAGVGLAQVRIMAELHGSTPRSQRLVASQLRQSEANVSRQVHGMKKHGLVGITKNKKDARQRDVVLTSKGKRKLETAEKLLQSQYKGMLKLLSKSEAKNFNNAVNHLLLALNVESRRNQKTSGSD